MMRRVNDEIREQSSSGRAPFFCECRDACFHAVWLDVAAYDLAVRTVTTLLATGHERSDAHGAGEGMT